MDEPAAPAPTPPQPRPDQPPETWRGVLAMLSDRKAMYEQAQLSQKAAPSRWGRLYEVAVWHLRWARYVLKRFLWPVLAAHLAHLHGLLLWHWRDLKINREKRLATFGLLGGFTLPALMIVLLVWLIPPDPETNTLEMDPSVPVPPTEAILDSALIEADPGEEAVVTLPTPPPETPHDEGLTRDNFLFDRFTTRDDKGQLKVLSRAAEYQLREWFPAGSSAVEFMRFFGQTLQRAGMKAADATTAAKQRCMSLPVNKLFTSRVVTCTYGHKLPEPLARRESAANRVFWIVALSYDNDKRITDLRLHARLTNAAP